MANKSKKTTSNSNKAKANKSSKKNTKKSKKVTNKTTAPKKKAPTKKELLERVENLSKDCASLQGQLAKAKNEKQELKRAKEVILSSYNKNFVPKSKLANETLIERLRWFYNDLSSKGKVIANVIGIVLTVIVSFASFKGWTDLGSIFDQTDIFNAVVGYVISAILGIFGLNLNFSANRLPKEKNQG